MENTLNWIHKEPEQDGEYYFSGQFLVTRGVHELLSQEEIKAIYIEVQRLVQEHDGLDYLQEFRHEESGERIWMIDQLSKSMIESGDYLKEYNYCTMLLPSEY